MATPPSAPEIFPSPPNLPPGPGLVSRLRFLARRTLDLQVQSVLLALLPWLARQRGLMLEVGCGAQPYRPFINPACRYLCLDWAGALTQFGYRAPQSVLFDGRQFPMQDAAFDGVFHTEVLEHVWNTRGFLAECRRVLKPGGTLFLSVPFQARYHYIPHDYWRFTPAALQRLLTEAGFNHIQVRPRGTDITVAVYKVISVFYRWGQSRNPLGSLLGLLLSPLLGLCLLLGHLTLRVGFGSADDPLGYTVEAVAAPLVAPAAHHSHAPNG